MGTVVGDALDWLAERLQPSGDAAIRGLEQDLARESTLEASWSRVCETAWALEFVELRMVPVPDMADILPERREFAPRPWPMPIPGAASAAAQSTWAFDLTHGGRTIATLTAWRRLGKVDFEPLQFVRAIQGIVDRFVVVRSAERPPFADAPAQPSEIIGTIVPSADALPSAES